MTVLVAIQERSRLLREGLALILDQEPEIGLVGSVVAGEALFALCEKTTPSVVLLEVDVREWDACRLAYRLQSAWPSMNFVGLYRREGEAAARARRCGLRRLVSLQANADELVGELTAAAVPSPPDHPAIGYHHAGRAPAHRPRDPGPAVHRGGMHLEADRGPYEGQPQDRREPQTADIWQARGPEPGTCCIGGLPQGIPSARGRAYPR